MSLQTAARPVTGAARPTQTQTTYDNSSEQSSSRHIGTLRLRGERRSRPGVRWAADVVDNSNMNKKKSKVCCIYHKPHAVGESSSESSSSSSESDSDSGVDNGMARMGGKGAARSKGAKKHQHKHDCDHGNDHDYGGAPDSSAGDDEDDDDAEDGVPPRSSMSARVGRVRQASPNAYEKMKTYKTKKSGGGIMTTSQTNGS